MPRRFGFLPLNRAALEGELLFYNQLIADQYVAEGWDPEAIFVARNCLDQAPIQAARRAWQDAPERLEVFRRENKIGPGPNILFVSRLHPTNRLELLVQATAELLKEFPEAEIFIIGQGDAEQQRLEQLAASIGISDRLRFVGAIYDEMQLVPWFLSSDIFCYPANIGLSLLHAFGYGLPVVTSDNMAGQNPEIEAIRPGKNGLLYTDGDASALADALRAIATDREQANAMSVEAIRTVEEEFTLENMVAGMAAAVRYCARTKPS